MSTADSLPIRPFREDDRESLVAIGNRDRPAHRHHTAQAWARWDAIRKPELVDLRLCVADADDRPIAFLATADLNTTVFKLADVVDFELTIAHEYRRQGLGGRLYETALAFAHERGAKRLVTGFREWTPEEPAIGFLTRRGFTEQERETPSFLDLAAWDEDPFLSAIAQAEAQDAHLFAYADVEDSKENRHRLYELQRDLVYDIPRRDTQPFTFEPYDDWLEFVITRPDWRPDLCFLASVGGVWAGQCHIVPKLEMPHVGMQWLTGTQKGYRGKGLATALKALAYGRAQAAGVTTIITENHEDNAPMLAINRRFGFVPEPAMVKYNKVLGTRP